MKTIQFILIAAGWMLAGPLRSESDRIASVRVTGDWPEPLPPAEEWMDLRQGNRFEPEQAQEQANRLMEVLRGEAYAGAVVRWSAAPVDNQSGHEVVFVVEAGPRFRIGRIMVNGEADAGLEAAFADEPASTERLLEVADAVRASLDGKGHAFAEMDAHADTHPHGEVDLFFQVKPGPVSVFHRLQPTGNTRTGDPLIAREFALRPGDRFNRSVLDAGVGRLEATGWFHQVAVTVEPVNEGKEFLVRVDVEEAQTGRIEAGLSWGEVEGAAFVTMLHEKNFALKPPFRGQGLDARLSATLGPEILRVEGGLGNPRVGRSFWALGGRVFYEDNAFVSDRYDQQQQGFHFNARKPLGLHQIAGIGWTWTGYELTNLDPLLAEELDASDRGVSLSGPTVEWRLDTADRLWRPRRGGRVHQWLHVGLDGPGGDTELVDWRVKGEWFVPTGKSVFRVHAETRHVFPVGNTAGVPLSLRTYLGGADTLKAFEYHRAAGYDTAGVLQGGESMWWGGVEWQTPIASALDISVYGQLGDVSEKAGDFRGEGPVAEAGMGLLIRAQNFPVRLDIAFPLSVLDTDPVHEVGKARVSFSAGFDF